MPDEMNVTTPTEVSAPSEPSTSSDTPSTASEPSTPSQSADSDVKVVVNPVSGERSVEFINKPETATEPTEQPIEQTPQNDTQQIEQPQQDTSTQPQTYANMEEVLQAVSTGNFDESKLTQEQMQTINAIQQRQAYMAQQQQIAQQAQAQAQQARQQAFATISQQAKQLALQEMGITDEELTGADYTEGGDELKRKFTELYNNKVLAGQYAYIQQEVQQQNKVESFRHGLQEVQNFCISESQKEPHYQEIVQVMDTAKMDLPYKQAQKIIQAEQNMQNGVLTQNDIATFREYYDYCKKQVYQSKNGVTTTPRPTATVPRVETSGQGGKNTPAPTLNFSSLRGLNQFERDKAVSNFIATMLN